MGKAVGWKERKEMVKLIALQSILCQLRVIEDFHTADGSESNFQVKLHLWQQQETAAQGLAISLLKIPSFFQFNLSSIWAKELVCIIIIELDFISFRAI